MLFNAFWAYQSAWLLFDMLFYGWPPRVFPGKNSKAQKNFKTPDFMDIYRHLWTFEVILWTFYGHLEDIYGHLMASNVHKCLSGSSLFNIRFSIFNIQN